MDIIKTCKRENKPFSLILFSILVAFFADLRAINWSLAYGGFAGGGMMNVLYPAVICCIVSLSFVTGKWSRNWNPNLIIILFYFAILYSVTHLFIGPPNIALPSFMAFVISALIIPSISKIDAKWFIRSVIALPSFAVLRLNQVFAPPKEWYVTVPIDAGYGFLIPIIAGIIYLFFYLKDDKLAIKVVMGAFLFVDLLFLLEILFRGLRGPLLCIFLLLLFLYIVKKSKNNYGVILQKKKLRTLTLALLLVLLFSTPIISFIDILLQQFDIEIYAIEKIIGLIEDNNLDNGRGDINGITWKGILNSPLFGHGLDRFDANTNLLYPHNFVLNILYDGGVFLFMVFLVPVFLNLIKKYRNCSYDEYIVLTGLLFCSVPGALFSLNMYTNGALWLFFGVCLSKDFVNRKNQIN